MTPRQNGFIIIFVVAVLGVLALLALEMLKLSTTQALLSQKHGHQIRSRLLARSGIEQSLAEIFFRLPYEPVVRQELKEKNMGPGTYKLNGNLFRYDFQDVNSAIDVNDGLACGQSQLGNAYDPSALDPSINNASALINLRIRRILNAYGEVHRFLALLGGPAVTQGQGGTFTHLVNDCPRRGAPIPVSEGLGDSLLAIRPSTGFLDWQELVPILDQWAAIHLPQSYLAGASFSDKVQHDIGVGALPDREFWQLTNDHTTFWEEINSASGDGKESMIDLKAMDREPPDFSNCWSRHPYSPVNMSAGSIALRAAVFYACANVAFSVEASATAPPHWPLYVFGNNTAMPKHGANWNHGAYLRSAHPLLGQGACVFDPSRMTENFHPSTGQDFRLMTLRDAVLLSESYTQYESSQRRIFGFNDFYDFLVWHVTQYAYPYERAVDPANYDDDPLKGYFDITYVEKTLPHILSPIRRLPGYLGAPVALLSPVAWTNAKKCSTGGLPPAVQRKAEDFVHRAHLPKVTFVDSGSYKLFSEGIVLAATDQILSRTTILARTQCFNKHVYRSQKDFERVTDFDLTDFDVLIGPNITSHRGGVANSSNWMGVVGLKSRAEDDDTAGIQMKFQGNFLSATGSRHPQNPATDPFTTDLLSSALEDSTFSFLQGCDLSPFGGVFLSSLGHGIDPDGNAKFEDSLYWRPTLGPNALIPTQVATGTSTTRGGMQMWFRFPSIYDVPYEITNWDAFWGNPNSGPFISHRFVFMLAHLRFFQRVRVASGNEQDAETDFYIFSTRLPSAPNLQVIARIENTLRQPISESLVLPEYDPNNTIQFDYLNPISPGAPDYDDWRASLTAGTLPGHTHALEWFITLKANPESAAGTWHQVSLKWDMPFRAGLTNWPDDWQSSFDFQINDKENIKDQLFRYFGAVNGEEVPKKYFHNLTSASTPVTLKNTNYRAWLHPCSLIPVLSLGEGHLKNSETYHTNEPDYYLDLYDDSILSPLNAEWRLNSCLDDFRLHLGFLPTLNTISKSHYHIDTDHEPQWIIRPDIPDGKKMFRLAARVYIPPDSKDRYHDNDPNGSNVPSVQLSLITQPDGNEIATPHNSSEQVLSYQIPHRKNAQTRLAVTWKNINEMGNTLIQDGTDSCNEIPWLKELEYHWTNDQISFTTWDQDN